MKYILGIILVIGLLAACDTNTASLDQAQDNVLLSLLATNPNVGIYGEAVGGTVVQDGLVAANVMPSSNESNAGKGWANVSITDDGVQLGSVTLAFTSTRTFASCFEYRVDGEANEGAANFLPAIADGLWPFFCQNNTSRTETLNAIQYVDVRMVFGAEGDERFDWTRFYVATPDSINECKNGQWEAMGFRNQGQCIQYVNTGKDGR